MFNVLVFFVLLFVIKLFSSFLLHPDFLRLLHFPLHLPLPFSLFHRKFDQYNFSFRSISSNLKVAKYRKNIIHFLNFLCLFFIFFRLSSFFAFLRNEMSLSELLRTWLSLIALLPSSTSFYTLGLPGWR